MKHDSDDTHTPARLLPTSTFEPTAAWAWAKTMFAMPPPVQDNWEV
jgi:hypothetical protein